MWFSRQLHAQILNPPNFGEQLHPFFWVSHSISMVDRCPIDGPTFLVMVGRNTQAPKPNKPSNLVLLLFFKRLFGKETILQKLRGDV